MENLPTLYEHYTSGGISRGLSVDQPYFTLNNKNISIYSGSMHYFRVPSEYWRDRLKKIRAAGLNAVETYVPWNLHEPEPGKLNVAIEFPLDGLDTNNYAADNMTPYRYNLYALSNHSGSTYSGHYTAFSRHPYTATWHDYTKIACKYDFGEGGTDMQELLNIEKYLKTAQEEDLFVIVRPGPFICAEFEFGGLPSWLLRETNIKIRTSDEKFMKHVRRYFNVLLTLLATFQFTRGGPIISFQVENEYGSTEDLDADPPINPDLIYVEELRQLMLANNITELLFTSDSPTGHASRGSLPSLFQTANFNSDPEKEFDKLKELQKNKPSMSTEYWAGWFNHWSEKHYIGNTVDFTITYERILKYPASVNLYMFHGGTSWGFLNGANMGSVNQSVYQPDITSYDYDAPLTEYGDYTSKYFAVKLLLEKFNPIKTKLPEVPIVKKPDSYPSLNISEFLRYENIISQLPLQVESRNLISMENLPINNNTGQQFGYILYRKRSVTINRFAVLKILGYVYDSVNVYVNNELITKNVVDLDSFGYWRKENGSINLGSDKVRENATIDIMVCNMGRNNFGSLDQFRQFKGLWQGILLDDQELLDWEIYPVEFKKSWISNLTGWSTFDASSTPLIGAGLFKAELLLKELHDTFLDMSKWRKGLVIVNNFVLGRYWKIGPQQSLYLPAPFLKIGVNEIIVFDEFSSGKNVSFSDEPIYLNNFVDDLLELS